MSEKNKKSEWNFEVDEKILREDEVSERSALASMTRDEAAQKILRRTKAEYIHVEKSEHKHLGTGRRVDRKPKKHRKLKVRYGGLGHRVVASVIDVLFYAAAVILSTVFLKGDSLWLRESYMSLLEGQVESDVFLQARVIAAALFIVPYALYRKHIGKKITGIRVVMENGHTKPGMLRFLLLREVVGKSLSIALVGSGLWMSLFNKRKKCLHDYLAGTIVIKG